MGFFYGREVRKLYQPRFVTEKQLLELLENYQLAKSALKPGASNYDRMIYASKHLHEAHPEISQTAAYKDLDAQIGRG